MINPDTIDDIDDCDGEAVCCFGEDAETREWKWDWVPIEKLIEAGRQDVVDQVCGRQDDDDEREAA